MIRGTGVFSAWTVFSFLCHYGAKEFVSREHGDGLILAGLLTLMQLACCYIFLSHDTKPVLSGGGGGGSGGGSWPLVLAVVTHVGATFSTNYSLAVLFAPSTLTIKLMEPLMSAFVVWLVLGKPVARMTVLALLVLIAGSLGFVGNPLSNLSLGGGTLLALISNILYGLRNIVIKHFLQTSMRTCDVSEYVVYGLVTGASVWVCNSDMALCFLMVSALCHVIYSYVSTNVVLQELSVVGHAVANICKRLLVVLLMVAVGQKQLEAYKYAWLGVCAVGMCMYAYHKVKTTTKGEPLVPTKRHQLVLISLTSTLFLLLAVTCISLARSPMVARPRTLVQHTHLRKEILEETVQRKIQDEAPHVAAPRKILSADEPTWDSLSDSIVAQIEPIVGRQKHVILSRFPVAGDRASAMENVGLLYVLQALGATIHHHNNKDKKPSQMVSEVRGQDSKKEILVVAAANKLALADLNSYLENDRVEGVLIFVPSVRGSQKTFYEDKLFSSVSRSNKKLKLFCHDQATLDMLRDQEWKDVTLVPALTFCIPRVYRFLKPLYHYVFQSGVADNGCRHIAGQPPSVRCDSRSWAVEKWTTPKGISAVEDVYLRTYIGYLYLLRGQVVIVDELAALLAAMQFDIPTVALITSGDSEMKAYIDTWQAHGYLDSLMLSTAGGQKQAAEKAMEMAKALTDKLVDFEPGIKIVKSFPR